MNSVFMIVAVAYTVLGEGNNLEPFGVPFNHTDLHPIRLGQTTDKHMII